MTGLIILIVYIAIFVGAAFVIHLIGQSRQDYTSLKTVTFSDESAVVANGAASIISVLTLFLIWATNSIL